jgi:hypothetical protein
VHEKWTDSLTILQSKPDGVVKSVNGLEPAVRFWPHGEVVPMADMALGREDRVVLLVSKWRENAVPHVLPEIRDAIGLDSEVVRHWCG